MVARWRTRTAIAGRAEVDTGLQRSPWQLRGLRIAGIERKLGYVRRDVHHQPVPEPAARGGIRIEASDGKALRAGGRFRPREMRRSVVARAADAKVGGENMGVGEIIAVLETVAPDRYRHTAVSILSSNKAEVAAILFPRRDVCLSVLLKE